MMDMLETHYINLVNNRIAYCEHGDGPDLLLLHGNSQNKGIFRSYQLEHFPDFHTIAVDSPGHGESASPREELCYESCCTATCSLCEHLGITCTNLIGYSDGANTALLMAKNAPQLLHRVVLISPNTRVDGMTSGTVKIIKLCVRGLNLLAHLGLKTDKAAGRMKMMLCDVPISEEELRTLAADFTILYAEHDVIREEHLLELASLIPGAVLQQIQGCSHLSILRHPDAINSMRSHLPA